MSDVVAERPDAYRLQLFRSVFEPSSLEAVAEAAAAATEYERRIYVERVGSGYRWSLTHPGGGYPLLRITAQFLRVDHTRIMVGFRTVTDGVCVLCDTPAAAMSADTWAVVEFGGATSKEEVEASIRLALGSDT